MTEVVTTRPKWATWAMRAVVLVVAGVIGTPLFAALSNGGVPGTGVWNVLTAVSLALLIAGVLAALVALFQFFSSRR